MLVSCSAVWAQKVQHAPTVEQCRADQKLWLSQFEDHASDDASVAWASFNELQSWLQTMHECATVDPANKLQYHKTKSESTQTQWARFIHFLRWHHLYDQFLAEDAAEDAQGKQ
jgi:hypothetical protein